MKQLLRMGLCVLCSTVVLSSNVQAGVGGFVDAQLYTGGASDTPNSPGFKVADGAVYLSKDLGKGKAMVDIPFFGMGATNTLTLATTKAQAYVNFGYDCGVDWTLGQFDTPFGFEGNDSVARHFSNAGVLKASNPLTHTGLMIGYTSGAVNFKAGVSNPNNSGLRGGDNFEYFGHIKYTADPYYFGAGYIHHKALATAESSMLADFVLGTKMSDLTLDVEVSLTKSAMSGATTGVGVLANIMYAVNKTWTVGARPEYLSKAIARGALTTTPTDSVFQVTFGPEAHVTDDLTVKLDYTLNSSKATSGATATTNHSGALAAVYKM